MKPGIKTTEFWTTLALFVVGTVLMAYGDPKMAEMGAIMMTASGFGYSYSRGTAKRSA